MGRLKHSNHLPDLSDSYDGHFDNIESFHGILPCVLYEYQISGWAVSTDVHRRECRYSPCHIASSTDELRLIPEAYNSLYSGNRGG